MNFLNNKDKGFNSKYYNNPYQYVSRFIEKAELPKSLGKIRDKKAQSKSLYGYIINLKCYHK